MLFVHIHLILLLSTVLLEGAPKCRDRAVRSDTDLCAPRAPRATEPRLPQAAWGAQAPAPIQMCPRVPSCTRPDLPSCPLLHPSRCALESSPAPAQTPGTDVSLCPQQPGPSQGAMQDPGPASARARHPHLSKPKPSPHPSSALEQQETNPSSHESMRGLYLGSAPPREMLGIFPNQINLNPLHKGKKKRQLPPGLG